MSRLVAALIFLVYMIHTVHSQWKEECTCYFGYVVECPKGQSCNTGFWEKPECKRMKPDIGKNEGKGGKHNNKENCKEVHKDGKQPTAPCDGLCGNIKNSGSLIKNNDDLNYATTQISRYYQAFRAAATKKGRTKLDQSCFVKLNDDADATKNHIDYYIAYHVMGLVNGFWGNAVIHDQKGTHKVQDHPIDYVPTILVAVTDEAIAIITKQLGVQTTDLSSCRTNAMKAFMKFMKDKGKRLKAQKVDIAAFTNYFEAYNNVLLQELGLEKPPPSVSRLKSIRKSISGGIAKLMTGKKAKSKKKRRATFGSHVVAENGYQYELYENNDDVENASFTIPAVLISFVLSCVACMVIGLCFGGIFGAVFGAVATKGTSCKNTIVQEHP